MNFGCSTFILFFFFVFFRNLTSHFVHLLATEYFSSLCPPLLSAKGKEKLLLDFMSPNRNISFVFYFIYDFFFIFFTSFHLHKIRQHFFDSVVAKVVKIFHSLFLSVTAINYKINFIKLCLFVRIVNCIFLFFLYFINIFNLK